MDMTVCEYARHRAQAGLPGGTPAAVRKALATERITTRPNGKIDCAAADLEWARNTSAVHQHPTPPPTRRVLCTPADVPSRGLSEFLQGARWLAAQLASSARKYWPALMAETTVFDKLPSDERVVARAAEAVLMIHALETWARDYLTGAALPDIDWSAYGEDAAVLAREAEDCRRYWDSSPV